MTDWFSKALFGPGSARALAALRIGVGLLTVAWSALLWTDLEPLLVQMRSPSDQILYWQPLLFLGGNGTRFLLVVNIVLGLALALGFWSKLGAWGAFLLTLTLQRYNPEVMNGGDRIFSGVLQLGVALGPSGAAWSLDARRRQNRGSRPVEEVEVWSLRYVQIHIAMGYLLTAFLKTQGSTWLDGTALWYALNIGDLARFPVLSSIGLTPIGSILTWLTLGTETLLGLGLFWAKTRPAALIVGSLLHLGIALLLEISFFSLVMVMSYLAFLPNSAFAPITSRLSRTSKLAAVEVLT